MCKLNCSVAQRVATQLVMCAHTRIDILSFKSSQECTLHRWNRNPRPQPKALSKSVFLICSTSIYLGL